MTDSYDQEETQSPPMVFIMKLIAISAILLVIAVAVWKLVTAGFAG